METRGAPPRFSGKPPSPRPPFRPAVDDLDHAILAELAHDRVLLWGGSDPRVSTSELATRLDVDRTTVRARMRRWEKVGFLRGFSALPNPLLFGVGVLATGLRVPDPAAKARVLDDLALVEGVLSAMEHVGEWIGLSFVEEGPASAERRWKLLARLPGVAEATPLHRWRPTPPTREPTPLDWRVLSALRAAYAAGGPRPTLRSLADRVGVGVSTVHARYDTLVRAGAVWSVPNLDFTRWTGAVVARLILELAPGADARHAIARVRDLVGPVFEQTSPDPMPDSPRVVSLGLLAQSPGAVEDALIAARYVAGVTSAEALFLKSFRVYGAWLDEKVQGRCGGPRSRAAR